MDLCPRLPPSGQVGMGGNSGCDRRGAPLICITVYKIPLSNAALVSIQHIFLWLRAMILWDSHDWKQG